jgi:hypothetical protein
MVFDGGAGEMLMFGGIDVSTRHTNELWRRSNGAWSPVAASGGPSPRSVSLMVFDGARRSVVLFGGDGGTTSFGDTWTWNGQAWTTR